MIGTFLSIHFLLLYLIFDGGDGDEEDMTQL
jgi:hypothetical protein